MNGKHKILALLLSVVLLFGIVPLYAFAEEDAAVAEETEETETSVLDQLAAKATGEVYSQMSLDALKANLGITGNSATGTAGKIRTEGAWGGAGTNAYNKVFGDVNGWNLNAQNVEYAYKDGEFQVNDKGTAADLSFGHIFTFDFSKATDYKYLVASYDLKLGEAVGDGRVFRLRGSYDATVEIIIKDADGNVVTNTVTATDGKTYTPMASTQKENYASVSEYTYVSKSGTQYAVAGTPIGYISESLFTNFTVIYNVEESKFDVYANGVLVKEDLSFALPTSSSKTVAGNDGKKYTVYTNLADVKLDPSTTFLCILVKIPHTPEESHLSVT